MTGLVRCRAKHREAFEQTAGVPLTYLAFAAHAVVQALRENKLLNARWDGDHITLNNRINLSIAVSTDEGLIVPVVHDANRLSITGLALRVHGLTQAARGRKLTLDDVRGGTFTLNNTGALGSTVSVPIINHPQAAIVTTEAIVKRPVVVEDDAVEVRSIMNVCLTFDHRVCDGAEAGRFSLPFTVLNGSPGYINLLDALNSWQLVRELKVATGLPAAASFKHVSPAGASVAVPMSDTLAKACFVDDMELSPLATAYARARGADRISSFGDWVALSETVDESTARLLRREVSDGVIAPGFSEEALATLTKKQSGRYVVLQVDPEYTPAEVETRTVFGITMEQGRNNVMAGPEQLTEIVTKNKKLPDGARQDLIVALTALKFTQSNSMCMALDGQVIGAGAGQQSRIHCTRLAGNKADLWYLRQHPATLGLEFRDGLGRPERDNAIDGFLRDDLAPAEDEVWSASFAKVPKRLTATEKRTWLDGLTGVAMGSDAFIPFRDNVDRAAMSGVTYVVQPGGSVRDEDVIAACDQYGMVMALSGVRLFHH